MRIRTSREASLRAKRSPRIRHREGVPLRVHCGKLAPRTSLLFEPLGEPLHFALVLALSVKKCIDRLTQDRDGLGDWATGQLFLEASFPAPRRTSQRWANRALRLISMRRRIPQIAQVASGATRNTRLRERPAALYAIVLWDETPKLGDILSLPGPSGHVVYGQDVFEDSEPPSWGDRSCGSQNATRRTTTTTSSRGQLCEAC
ncbi:MAG: hypothetical protein QOH16_3896 [Gaiellaceae bacterium]|nr:hypothetical protein [Gaiellaceae bacterium]